MVALIAPKIGDWMDHVYIYHRLLLLQEHRHAGANERENMRFRRTNWVIRTGEQRVQMFWTVTLLEASRCVEETHDLAVMRR